MRTILDRRANLVLKPNDDYGGKGITLGWTVDDATWEEALRTALSDTAPFSTNSQYMRLLDAPLDRGAALT